jgi:hypothetical protein
MKSSEAIIYLSGARACIQDDNYRSYQTLKQPFRDLTAVNDETLVAGASITHKAPVVIIPLVGDVITNQRIGPGQIQVTTNPTITNPYKEELVNYLIIGIKGKAGVYDFNLINNNIQSPIPGIQLGKFDGRKDGIHKLSQTSGGAFVFAIEGAFEVQNRLLHPRDGLALTDITEIEFEALSNEAILLMIEVN